MDDLIVEFIAETAEGLGELDTQLVALEQNPSDAEIIGGIFRIVHTIKGTCGFLGLPRLESVAHSAENVLGKFRDKELTPSADSVSLILRTLDCIKDVLAGLEETGSEPAGDDSALIAELDAMAAGETAPAAAAAAAEAEAETEAEDDEIDLGAPAVVASAEDEDADEIEPESEPEAT
ncbi:MAG: Hpt domain-containing protein, partial [Alphaproteobacteria bacterium]